MTTAQILDNAINDAAARMFRVPRVKPVVEPKPQIVCDCCGKLADEESACGKTCEDCATLNREIEEEEEETEFA